MNKQNQINSHICSRTSPVFPFLFLPSFPPPLQMQKVVSNLAEIEQPWNCPHGRPTMRHLVDLTTLQGGEGI